MSKCTTWYVCNLIDVYDIKREKKIKQKQDCK